jgi:hypothetical protein
MTSKTLKSAIWLTLIASAVALAAPGGVPGPGGGGGGGGGGKPTTEATNNLSVPAIMAGGMGAFSALSCAASFTVLDDPDKAPVFYPYSEATTNDGLVTREAGYFYVQRDAKWQAPCVLVAAGTIVDAIGAWGDNLAGDARLKVGSPIRVELVLKDGGNLAIGQQGYLVEKLELTELDRVSDYGHRADGGLDGPWEPHEYTVGTDVGFAAIVHDPSARLKIDKIENDVAVRTVYDEPAGGEINATGKIIYGYGLRVTEAGTYRLTYSFTNVNIRSCEETAAVCGGSTASLDIVVAGGGGGGKPVKPPK